jgi:hypothetical protein
MAEPPGAGGGGVNLGNHDGTAPMFEMSSGSIVDNRSNYAASTSNNFHAASNVKDIGIWPEGTEGYAGGINTQFNANTTPKVSDSADITPIVRGATGTKKDPGKNLWAVRVAP